MALISSYLICYNTFWKWGGGGDDRWTPRSVLGSKRPGGWDEQVSQCLECSLLYNQIRGLLKIHLCELLSAKKLSVQRNRMVELLWQHLNYLFYSILIIINIYHCRINCRVLPSLTPTRLFKFCTKPIYIYIYKPSNLFINYCCLFKWVFDKVMH